MVAETEVVTEARKPVISLAYNCEIRNSGSPVLIWDAAKRGLGLGDNVRRLTRPMRAEDLRFTKDADLLLFLDDGRDDIPWAKMDFGCPTAYWAVDTHLGYPNRLEKARDFDYVFCAQKDGAERMASDGIKNVYWLPLACHPLAHPNFAELMCHAEREKWESMGGLTKQHDVAFVGFINEGAGPGSHNRLEYLHELFQAFPNSWVTTSCFLGHWLAS